jgi:hypothetical protein
MKTEQPRGPQTGIAALDQVLGGLLAPGLHLLQATPGAGKSAMALQFASDCKHPALYSSAEMPTLELFKRLIARQPSTYLGRLTGQMNSCKLEDRAHQVSRLRALLVQTVRSKDRGEKMSSQLTDEQTIIPTAEAIASEVASILARQISARDILRLLQVVFLDVDKTAERLRVKPKTDYATVIL